MGIVKINNDEYKLLDGYSINYNNYETLNNATLKLRLNVEKDFNYFDKIILNNNYFYLVEWERNKINNTEFDYVVQVVNPVISMQNVFLPNRAVEKGKNIGSYMLDLLLMYDNNLSLSSELYNLVKDTTTTQYTWSEPTLYEVFNSLLKQFNAVVTMDNFNTINYIKLDKRGSDISHLKINNIKYKTDYNNYASDFQTKLKNAISDNIITEYQFLTTENEPILNDKKFNLFLNYPIERVNKIGVLFYEGEEERYKNITNLLVEKRYYDTLKPSNSVSDVPATGYKRNHIWYDTGKNYIGGLDYDDNAWFPIINVSKPSYDYWGFRDISFSSGIRGCIFVVEYEAQINEVSVSLRKDALNNGFKTKLVNQDEPFIDLDSFATKQMLDLERSGELGIEIYGEGTPPQLMDYYDDFNIYSLNVVYNNNSLSWFAEAKRGFSYNNLSTSISSEKVFSEIESADKAFLSNHINIKNYEFSDEPGILTDNIIAEVFTFRLKIGRTVLFINTDNKSFLLSPLLEKYGNSLIYTYKFKDNYSVGINRAGGDQQESPYVNSSGEFRYLSNYLMLDTPMELIKKSVDDENTGIYDLIYDLPTVKSEKLLTTINSEYKLFTRQFMLRNKTNREITAETQQFNLLSNEKVTIWNDYISYAGWGLINKSFKKDDFEIYINRSDRLINKMDYAFMTEKLPVSGWTINDTNFKFDISGHTGLVIVNKVDNKPILSYNGGSDTLYIVDSHNRFIVEDNNEYNDLIAGVDISINSNIDGGVSLSLNMVVGINSTIDNIIYEGVELYADIGVTVTTDSSSDYPFNISSGINIVGNISNTVINIYK